MNNANEQNDAGTGTTQARGMGMNDITALSRRQTADNNAFKRASRIHESLPFDGDYELQFSAEGHARHIVLPDTDRTVEIVEALCHDSEALGRLYEWSNRDYHRESDAWKARRFEEFMADYFNAATVVAREEMETT